MTLKSLLQQTPLDAIPAELRTFYNQMLNMRPTYGLPDMKLEVKKDSRGLTVVANAHLGSLSDVLGRQVSVAPNVLSGQSMTDVAVLCLRELAADGFNDGDHERFWNEMDDLQRAKLLR